MIKLTKKRRDKYGTKDIYSYGKRIGIQFRVKPSLLKPLEGTEAIVTKVTKADGKERELESRYTQSYRPKKADG